MHWTPCVHSPLEQSKTVDTELMVRETEQRARRISTHLRLASKLLCESVPQRLVLET